MSAPIWGLAYLALYLIGGAVVGVIIARWCSKPPKPSRQQQRDQLRPDVEDAMRRALRAVEERSVELSSEQVARVVAIATRQGRRR